MHTPFMRLSGARSAAMLVALVTATGGLAAVPAAAAGTPGASGTVFADGTAGTDGGRSGVTWVTLVTGDRVAVDGNGGAVSVRRAEGREGVPFSVRRHDGRTYVVPADARKLVRDGRVDLRLFDVTELARAEYRERGEDLPLIVTYRGARPAAKQKLRAAGTEVTGTYRSVNGEAVTAEPEIVPDVWEALTDEGSGTDRSAAPGVDKVFLDGVRKASLDRSTAQIGAPEAWKTGFDGKGVKIAVLDTGVDQTHPDLKDVEVAEKNFSDAADAVDRVGHGTHVASIAAGSGAKANGKYKGVAPGATILDGKVLDDNGSGYDSGILAGMEWAAAQGAKVVNLSLGGYDTPELDPLEEAVNRLSKTTGALFVIAAGNEGPGSGTTGTIGSPGSADAALTVAAVDKQDVLADFSSQGPRNGDGGLKPDIAAPGVGIVAAKAAEGFLDDPSSPEGYLSLDGTSMATPHVAGAAAILAQKHPDWTGAQLKSALTGSAKGLDGLGAFQQGNGRADIVAALGQSVVGEQSSLGFGVQQWPHHDDKPQSKDVVYRNLGTEPVTLDLALRATGPDGKAAPKGLFAVSPAKVTVPAGGTASATVTTDTRIGSADGAYSGAVVATGGGQNVRTAVAVVREVESYTLTVKHLGRDGKAAGDYETTLAGLDDGTFEDVYDADGTASVRLPKGSYLVNSSILVSGAGDEFAGADWLTRPGVELTRDTTVTMDARAAKPIRLAVPDRGAELYAASADYGVTTEQGGFGFGWFLEDFGDVRTAHLGAALPGDALHAQITGDWTGKNDHHLAYSRKGTFWTGYERTAKASELAAVKVTAGAPAKKQKGHVALFADTGGFSFTGASVERALPSTVTHLVNTDGVKWSYSMAQTNAQDEYVAEYFTGNRNYRAGRKYTERFNVGVFGPKLGDGAGLFRTGDEIYGYLPLVADGAGHDGYSVYDKGRTVLYRNGRKVAESATPLEGEPITVPAGRADYRLRTEMTRSGFTAASTRVSAEWTFSSKRPGEDEVQLPASVVRFTPKLSSSSTAKAGTAFEVPVTVQGSAAGKNLASLTVQVSYDGGKTWKRAKVAQGKVKLKHPKAAGTVSFRAKAADRKGNTVTQTIVNAYLTK
ncbi:S8 family serine peptidase [Streptomyces sp. NPDC059637]|uniref:S8 family peptidase n=1 Tax=Streptomyces sp. NPDC059637 TaxID=3347752 RepID=UPI0036B1EB2B